MEKNTFTIASLGLESKDSLQPKRDCGFYMRYFFLFLSLIQFLIILGLVLFMIYSNPLEGTEKHLKGLTNQLQESEKKTKALNEELGKLKRQFNTSEKDARLLQSRMYTLNTTLRLCNNEKAKLKEQQQTSASALLSANDCKFNLQLLNISCVAQVTSLQKQLMAQELKSQMEQDNLSRERKSWQEKAEKAEKEKSECQLAKLQLETREQKYQELKSKVLAELAPVQQNLRTTMDQFLSSYEIRGCYRPEMENMFLSLSRNLQNQFDAVARNLDQKVNEVAQENSQLQRQSAACQQKLQEQENQYGAQQQQCEWQKQLLQEAHELESKKTRGEYKILLEENDFLKQQLLHSKQACLNVRGNPLSPGNTAARNPSILGSFGAPNTFGTFPRGFGNTGTLGNPGVAPANSNPYNSPNIWGRQSAAGQPSSGTPRTLSTAEQNKFQEILKAAMESGKLSNPGPVNPAGQLST